MENNDASALLHGIPGGSNGIIFGIIRLLCGWVFDRIALASEGAGDCYADVRLIPRKPKSRDFHDLPEECREERVRKIRRVTFMAAGAPQGVPDLLAAWTKSGMGEDGWELAVAGTGPLAEDVARAAESDPSMTVLGMIDRGGCTNSWATTSVRGAAVPAGRAAGARQIGLPIVEGLAHGCHIVATRIPG